MSLLGTYKAIYYSMQMIPRASYAICFPFFIINIRIRIFKFDYLSRIKIIKKLRIKDRKESDEPLWFHQD